MYIVTIREYKIKSTIILNIPDSHRACLELLYDAALQYIYNKQGSLLLYDELIHNKNSYPDIRGKNIFYIQRSIDNLDKIYVIKRSRDYGYLYNGTKFSKKLRLEICYINDYKFYIDEWEYDIDDKTYDNYEFLLKEFSDYAKDKILPKLDSNTSI